MSVSLSKLLNNLKPADLKLKGPSFAIFTKIVSYICTKDFKNYLNGRGRFCCYTTVHNLVDDTGFSESTVKRSLKNLQGLGFLELKRTNSNNYIYYVGVDNLKVFLNLGVKNEDLGVNLTPRVLLNPSNLGVKNEDLGVKLTPPIYNLHSNNINKKNINNNNINYNNNYINNISNTAREEVIHNPPFEDTPNPLDLSGCLPKQPEQKLNLVQVASNNQGDDGLSAVAKADEVLQTLIAARSEMQLKANGLRTVDRQCILNRMEKMVEFESIKIADAANLCIEVIKLKFYELKNQKNSVERQKASKFFNAYGIFGNDDFFSSALSRLTDGKFIDAQKQLNAYHQSRYLDETKARQTDKNCDQVNNAHKEWLKQNDKEYVRLHSVYEHTRAAWIKCVSSKELVAAFKKASDDLTAYEGVTLSKKFQIDYRMAS